MPDINSFTELHFRLACDVIKSISEEFEDEIERKPTVLEVLEILSWTIRGISSDLIEDIHPSQILGLELRLAGSQRINDVTSAQKEVINLNDAVFVVASDSLSDLLRRAQTDTGRVPTINEVCKILIEGFHRCEPGVLLDVDPSQVSIIGPLLKKGRKIVTRPGDIVAIPAGNENYFFACVITKNQFGVAFGFFKTAMPLRPISLQNHPEPFKYPIYSGEGEIVSGRWKLIGNDKQLLDLFPSDPEIFHRKEDEINADDPEIGPFGSGETASGELRNLTEEEAHELGLLSGEYRQGHLEEDLEEELPKILGA